MKQRRADRENIDNSADVAKLIRRGEQQANRFAAQIMVCLIVVYFLVGIAFSVGFFNGFKVSAEVVFANVAILFISILLSWISDGNGGWVKYEMISVLLISAFLMNLTAGYRLCMLYTIPLLITCRYYNLRFTIFSGAFALVLTVISAFTNAYGVKFTGLYDLGTVSFDGGANIFLDGFMYDEVLASTPDPVTVLKNTLRISTLPNCIIIVCVTLVGMEVILHGQKLLLEADREANARAYAETRLEHSKLRVFRTQLQPHFLYNTLSAIMAIDGNPDETVEALGEFGKYLRENLSSIVDNEKIPFSTEIRHTMRYLSMEKLRFGSRLSVDYNIGTENFELPPLSVQLLAENAVKHGITERADGGHILISSEESEKEYIVTVKDDGVGFDTSAPVDTENHTGLANLKTRLETICGGCIEIISSVGCGTKAIIHVPKVKGEEKYADNGSR